MEHKIDKLSFERAQEFLVLFCSLFFDLEPQMKEFMKLQTEHLRSKKG